MRLLVVGAGGHAKVVVDAALQAGHDIACILGDEGGRTEILGLPVITGEVPRDVDRFIVAIGDNEARARRYAELVADGLTPASVIHPTAVIAETASVGPGCLVAAGVIVNPDARVAEDSILNTGCIVEHDCTVGAHTHLGPSSTLCGAVTTGEGVLLGVGASVVPGARIGAWSVVGAGAAVASDLGEHSVYAGVPARLIRRAGGAR